MRVAVVVASLFIPSVALAHIQLVYPPARTTEQKTRVCGNGNSPRGTNVTVLQPGATIEVRWNETINHPGHFRISFDADGQDFSIPPDATSDTGLTDDNVLLDLIADDPNGGMVTQMITLPDIECDTCTLQVIQLMTDKPPYTTDAASNDIYYQCADITLSRTAPMVDGATVTPDAGEDPGDGDDTTTDGDDGTTDGSSNNSGGGCATTGGDAGVALVLGSLGLVLQKRRRLRRV